jgi:hypothetical protein
VVSKQEPMVMAMTERKKYILQTKKLTKDDIAQKLTEYEARYGMKSREFISRYNTCQLEENPDYMDWAWYYDLAADAGLVSLKPGRES